MANEPLVLRISKSFDLSELKERGLVSHPQCPGCFGILRVSSSFNFGCILKARHIGDLEETNQYLVSYLGDNACG